MGLYFDGVGVLVLVSMQNQVVWGLIVGFLCRLLWWVWSLRWLNISCWFEVEEKKDGFIIIINFFFFSWVFDFVVLQSRTEFLFLIWQDLVYFGYSTMEERRKLRMNVNSSIRFAKPPYFLTVYALTNQIPPARTHIVLAKNSCFRFLNNLSPIAFLSRFILCFYLFFVLGGKGHKMKAKI